MIEGANMVGDTKGCSNTLSMGEGVAIGGPYVGSRCALHPRAEMTRAVRECACILYLEIQCIY